MCSYEVRWKREPGYARSCTFALERSLTDEGYPTQELPNFVGSDVYLLRQIVG